MITKDNVNYLDLYDGAYKALTDMNAETNNGTTLEKIHNLDDYFMYLGSIAKLVLNGTLDPIYLILPIEEELFRIDANTRMISVPETFRKNGVGVLGDEVAEILYFSIDRYFDINDLYYKEIYVQWESADKTQKLSPVINKTLLKEANKIIFGWPIGKEMTNKSGNITFSVRFFERENSKLIYSFSTTQATVKINSGLNINVDFDNEQSIKEMLCDKRDLIFNNLKNSATVESIQYPALKPVFEIVDEYQEYEYDNNGNIIAIYQGLPHVTDLNEDGTYTFEAKAEFDDNGGNYGAGFITYTWYPENDNSDNAGIYKYKETKDVERDINDIYYYYDDENDKYIKYIFSDSTAKLPTNILLFEKYSTYTVDGIGEYYVKAHNTAGKGNVAETRSNICTIPGAQNPIINYNNFENSNSGILDEENKKIIHLIKYHSNDVSFNINSVEKGSLSYLWQSSNDNINYDNINTNGLESNYIIPAENYNNYYRLLVTHTRNKDSKNTESYPIENVALPEPLSKENLSYYINDSNKAIDVDNNEYVIMQNEPPVFRIEIENTNDNLKINNEKTEILYQWYKYNANNDWEIIEGETTKEFTATVSKCYCQVKTRFYGEYETESVDSIVFTWYLTTD